MDICGTNYDVDVLSPARLDDPELRGRAMHALDDAALFVFGDRRGWRRFRA